MAKKTTECRVVRYAIQRLDGTFYQYVPPGYPYDEWTLHLSEAKLYNNRKSAIAFVNKRVGLTRDNIVPVEMILKVSS